MTTKTTSKYTPAMVQMLRDAAPLNQERATELAELFGGKDEGFSARSVAAKCTREGIAYERKERASKDGSPIERKEAIVAEIANLVGESMDGLEKAPKGVLRALRTALAA